MCPDVLDDGRSAGIEALARRVISVYCIRAEQQARGFEARLAVPKSDCTQIDRAVQEGDRADGSPATAREILDSGGQGDRSPEVRRPGLRFQGGSRGGSYSKRTHGADGHTHRAGAAGSEGGIAAVGSGDGVGARHQRRGREGCLIKASHLGQADGGLRLAVDREGDGTGREAGTGGGHVGRQGGLRGVRGLRGVKGASRCQVLFFVFGRADFRGGASRCQALFFVFGRADFRETCTSHFGRMDVDGWRTRPRQDFSQIVRQFRRSPEPRFEPTRQVGHAVGLREAQPLGQFA